MLLFITLNKTCCNFGTTFHTLPGTVPKDPFSPTPSFSDEKTGTHISNLPRSANGYRKLDRKLLLYPVVLPSPTSALVSDTQMERHLASSPREELKMLVPPRVQQGRRLSRLGWCHPLADSWQDPGQGCTQSQWLTDQDGKVLHKDELLEKDISLNNHIFFNWLGFSSGHSAKCIST